VLLLRLRLAGEGLTSALRRTGVAAGRLLGSLVGGRSSGGSDDTGGGGELHVDDDALDGDGLVGDVDDLTAGEVVLVVAGPGRRTSRCTRPSSP
jgi:hypothetical protein